MGSASSSLRRILSKTSGNDQPTSGRAWSSGPGLALEQGQVVQRLEDHLPLSPAARVLGNPPAPR